MKLSLAPLALLIAGSASAADNVGCFEGARHFHPDDWSYCQPINDDMFLYYTPLEDTVMLGLHVAQDAHGYSALAIAGNGGMKGASQIVVRMDDDGEWMVEDRHSDDYVTPSLDDQQDVKLLFANQTDEGETSWGVLLPLNSCDPNDYPIRDRKIFLHWALGDDHAFGFHGSRRGQFHANLLQAPKEEPDTEGLEHIDIQMPNVPVVLGPDGSDPTNPYICSVFDLEELSQGRFGGDKIHVTQFSPILDNQQYVHHMILYACSGDAKLSHLQVEPECESMPRGCREMKWSWALGGGDTIFPENVGMPVAEDARFVVLQMHYFNPKLDEGVTDSSGVKVYFTPELREQEAGVLQLNGGVNSWQRPALPMGVSQYHLAPFVLPGACTASRWTGPLNILGVGHHMHLHGTKMEILVERNGVSMGAMREEHHYDFNHQAMQEPVPELTQLLPGDQIITKCTYDTSDADQEVEFGDATQNEMCYSPVIYYPAKNQIRDTFSYTTPNANVTLCQSPATEELFVNLSLCAQEMFHNVPKTLGYGNRLPLTFGLLDACNGGDQYAMILDRAPGICPVECSADASCTEEELAAHAQIYCGNFCDNNLNVSLYPDLSRTEPNTVGVWGCPDGTNMFRSPELLEPPVCQKIGDLSQNITLQPVMSSGRAFSVLVALAVSALVAFAWTM